MLDSENIAFLLFNCLHGRVCRPLTTRLCVTALLAANQSAGSYPSIAEWEKYDGRY